MRFTCIGGGTGLAAALAAVKRLDPEPSAVVGRGQEAVNHSSAIQRIHLDPPEPKAHRDAVDAIERADVVLIGPGSLFTSVIPPFLVPGIRDAVSQARGLRVFVANLA